MNPGDQSQLIEDYLRAKGNDGINVSAEAYRAALKIAAIALLNATQHAEASLSPDLKSTSGNDEKTNEIQSILPYCCTLEARPHDKSFIYSTLSLSS